MASAAHAQGGLKLGVPSYGGTGCPAGSASVSLSPDEEEVSILFDQYVVEAGRAVGKRLDRKSCNISIPVTVPQGYSVSIIQVDYRGFNAVPSGGYSRLTAEYFWAGMLGPRISRTFYGPNSNDYTVSDQLIASALVWSPCGAQTNLRINSGMMVQTNSRQEDALATVDSVDMSSGLIYHLQWRRCI